MARHNRLTSKGQVTIPKDVRNALGLKPGEPVAFEQNDSGEFVVRKPKLDPRERERRVREALEAIEEARRVYPLEPLGMSTDDYMARVREPVPVPREL